MKRMVLTAALILFVAAGLFATDLQLGLGGGINYQGMFGMRQKTSLGTQMDVTSNDFGLYIFFDATYVQLDVIYFYGFTEYDYINTSVTEDVKGSTFEMALLGKYPFALEKFTIFPLLGIGYQFKYSYGGLGFFGGIGADFPLTDRLYLRSELLYGIRLGSGSTWKTTKIGHTPRVKIGIGFNL